MRRPPQEGQKPRRWPLAGSCAGEEGLELLAKGAVRRRLLGMRRFGGTSGVHGAAKRVRGACLL
jgi:hypothetical protein